MVANNSSVIKRLQDQVAELQAALKTDRSGRTFEEYRQLYWDGQRRIAELKATIKRVSELQRYAVARAGYQGWEAVPAEGFESQTFVDYDDLQAALKEQSDE